MKKKNRSITGTGFKEKNIWRRLTYVSPEDESGGEIMVVGWPQGVCVRMWRLSTVVNSMYDFYYLIVVY